MKWTVAALFATSLLAGCLSGDDASDALVEEPTVIVDEDRPEVTFGEVVTGPAVGPDLDATTSLAPRLVLGEWWRIRFDTALEDELVEVVRVVADVNEDGYIMGMPHEGWLKEAISFHSPAFGDVNFDLSYNTHNVLFEPVRFPLVAGETWETTFATQPYIATVEHADDQAAIIVFDPITSDDPATTLMGILADSGDASMRLTYDATQHEIVRMESPIGTWEVVEHGYDYEGWVTVPRGEDTAIDYGTFLPASDTHAPVERTLEVDGGFNRMTMMHFVGSVGASPGYFRIRDVTPDGTEWMTEMQGSGWHIQFYETNMPDGTWTVEDVAGGAGFTYSMGIAYHQYDILLPTGERRTDHSHEVVR